MNKVLSTKAEVVAVLEDTFIPDSFWEEKGIDPNKHFHDLTADEIAILSEVYIQTSRREFVELNMETIPALLGLREVMPGEVPWVKIGKKAFIAELNATNRMLSNSRSDDIFGWCKAGMFATSTSLAIGSHKQWINGAHRGSGVVKMLEFDPTYKVVVPIEFGVPPQLRDLWDFKNKEKKVKDLLFQNPDWMDRSVLDQGLVDGELSPLPETLEPAQYVKWRDRLSNDYASFAGFTLQRLSGRHIHGRADDRDILRFDQRCEQAQQLMAEVYRRSIGGEGKQLQQYKRLPVSQIASVLLLASNVDNDDTTSLDVDWALVDTFLSAMATSTEASGPLALMLAKVAEAFKGQKKRLPRKGVYDTLVNSVKQFMDSGEVTDNPVPNEKELAKTTFPVFGGVDVGHVEEAAE